MNPSFTDITYFVEIAETKNISRAAQRLAIAQPSLSSAVKRLEDSVGAQLLIRSRNGVQLTKVGREFLAKSRTLLTNWTQLCSDINRNQNEVCGRYIIGCHPSVAMYSLSRFLPDLITKNEDLEINLVHDLSRCITEKVIHYEVDFGIVVNPISHPDLVIINLCHDEVGFWVSKHLENVSSLDIASRVLICDPNLLQTEKILSDLTKRKIGFRRMIHSSNLEVIADLTNNQVGIGLLPKRVATQFSYQLRLLDSSLPSFNDKICLVYRAEYAKTLAARTIIEAIKKSFRA